MGLSSSHVLFPMPWGGRFLWLLLGWFLIGKVCHGKAFPWEGLPMGRASHGKGFSLARFLRGKVSIHQMGLSSSHVLFPMPWGGCFLWLLLGWFLIGKVCH